MGGRGKEVGGRVEGEEQPAKVEATHGRRRTILGPRVISARASHTMGVPDPLPQFLDF